MPLLNEILKAIQSAKSDLDYETQVHSYNLLREIEWKFYSKYIYFFSKLFQTILLKF